MTFTGKLKVQDGVPKFHGDSGKAVEVCLHESCKQNLEKLKTWDNKRIAIHGWLKDNIVEAESWNTTPKKKG